MATTAAYGSTAAANGHSDTSAEAGRNHIIIFPFMAKGHTLPLLHLATALSHHRNLHITLLTTPASFPFVRRRLPPSVTVESLPFPSLPPLPAGVESTDALPSPSLYPVFLRATALLRQPFTDFLAALPLPPLVLVSDFFLGFTYHVACEAGLRRIVFHGMSAFSMAICKALFLNLPPNGGGGRPFRVPGMPEKVMLTMDEVPEAVANVTDPEDPVTQFLFNDVGQSDTSSWGVLVNSFVTLDGDYMSLLESFYTAGARAWLVGPLFLAAGESPEKEEADPEGCLPWLDKRAGRPGSVVYVAFGTQVHISEPQLDELAHGLVGSGHPFLWAVRSDTWAPPVDVGPAGKIVRGWVPQKTVLAHQAVGGSVSHCGWNSVLESLAAGLPMLAWPMIAEQQLNAKHVVEILGVGVRVGKKTAGEAVVGRVEVADRVRELMDVGEEGQRMRERVKEIQQAAGAAVAEGGTSHLALRQLIDDLQRNYDIGNNKIKASNGKQRESSLGDIGSVTTN